MRTDSTTTTKQVYIFMVGYFNKMHRCPHVISTSDYGLMLPCRYAAVLGEPVIDASQDISDVTATHDNGITTITFTRPRVSTDNRDLSLDQCVYFLYAWGGPIDYSTCRGGQHTNREPSDFQFCIPDNCSKEICWVSRVCYVHVLGYTPTVEPLNIYTNAH